MKKVFYLLTLSVLIASTSFAQDDKKTTKEGTSLSVGLEAGLPLGDFGKGSSFGIGGSVKAGLPIFDGGAVTLSAGYMSFMAKTVSGVKGNATGIIPIKAGLRFRISEGFYGEPQLGVSMVNAKYLSVDQNGNPTTVSANKSYFTYAAGVGYMMKQIDIGVRYEAFSQKVAAIDQNFNLTTKSVATGFVGLRIAYNFGL